MRSSSASPRRYRRQVARFLAESSGRIGVSHNKPHESERSSASGSVSAVLINLVFRERPLLPRLGDHLRQKLRRYRAPAVQSANVSDIL